MRSYFSVLRLVFLIATVGFANGSDHQVITLEIPGIPTNILNVAKGDLIIITLSETFSTSYSFTFLDAETSEAIEDMSIQIPKICTWEEECFWSVRSSRTGIIYFKPVVTNYQYRYRVQQNGETVIDEYIHSDMMFGSFAYDMPLDEIDSNYTFRFLLQSENVQTAVVQILAEGQPVEIKANHYIEVNLTLYQAIESYSIDVLSNVHDQIDQMGNPLLEPKATIAVEVPNELLKGCQSEGTFYDQNLRVCPFNQSHQRQESEIVLHYLYPYFELKQKTTFTIRIFIQELQNLKEIFHTQKLKLSIWQTTGKNLWLKETFLSKNVFHQQISTIFGVICSFKLTLNPGNYSVNPQFLNVDARYPYLFERLEGKTVMDRYYSVMHQTYAEEVAEMGLIDMALEFTSLSPKQLVEVNIESAQTELFIPSYVLISGKQHQTHEAPMKETEASAFSPQFYIDTDQSPQNIRFYIEPKEQGVYYLQLFLYPLDELIYQMENNFESGRGPALRQRHDIEMRFRIKNAELPHIKIEEIANFNHIQESTEIDNQGEGQGSEEPSTETDTNQKNYRPAILLAFIVSVTTFGCAYKQFKKCKRAETEDQRHLVSDNSVVRNESIEQSIEMTKQESLEEK